jgi:hypothetical protein
MTMNKDFTLLEICVIKHVRFTFRGAKYAWQHKVWVWPCVCGHSKKTLYQYQPLSPSPFIKVWVYREHLQLHIQI